MLKGWITYYNNNEDNNNMNAHEDKPQRTNIEGESEEEEDVVEDREGCVCLVVVSSPYVATDPVHGVQGEDKGSCHGQVDCGRQQIRGTGRRRKKRTVHFYLYIYFCSCVPIAPADFLGGSNGMPQPGRGLGCILQWRPLARPMLPPGTYD